MLSMAVLVSHNMQQRERDGSNLSSKPCRGKNYSAVLLKGLAAVDSDWTEFARTAAICHKKWVVTPVDVSAEFHCTSIGHSFHGIAQLLNI